MEQGERSVSLTCVAAWGLWVGTFLLILASTVVGLVAHNDHLPVSLSLMAHGLACSAAAATVSIKSMLRNHDRLLRSAFDLGRDSSASGGAVRRMH